MPLPLLLLTLVAAALLVPLAIHGLRSHRRAQRADHWRMLVEGGRAEGRVVALAPAAAGAVAVSVEFTGADGRAHRFVQPASAQAVAVLGLRPGAPLAVRHRLRRPALAFAPALAGAEYASRPELAPAPGAAAALYVVAFEDPDHPHSLHGRNAFGWRSGELVVDGATLEIRAIRERPFRRPARSGRILPLAAVQNVEACAHRVALELVLDGKVTPLTLWTVDEATARDLARRLPAARTPSFVPALAEAADFYRRLAAATPTVPVTQALIALNLLAFAGAALAGAGWLHPDPVRLLLLGSNYTPLTEGGQWWRLLSSSFLHFGLLHVGFNMWALAVNGPFAERLYGSTRYLLVYLVAALGASVASLLWHPLVNSAGASGAIFGVFGATLAFFVRAPEGLPASVARSHRNAILQFIVLTLVLGVQVKFIDHAAHLGGLVVGFVLGYALTRPVDAPHADPARERAQALGVAVAAVALVAIAVLGAPTNAAISATVPGGVPGIVPEPTLTTFAGIRLGQTRAEVLAARGAPRVDRRDTWLYDVGEPGAPAILDVTFHVTGGRATPADPVGAVFYRGDKAHAPPELLYVTGQPRARLSADFGVPAWLLHGRDGVDYEMYADGLTVEYDARGARAYGLQDYYRTLHP